MRTQHRDHAYHQGTVWSWLIGPFALGKRLRPQNQVLSIGSALLNHFQQQVAVLPWLHFRDFLMATRPIPRRDVFKPGLLLNHSSYWPDAKFNAIPACPTHDRVVLSARCACSLVVGSNVKQSHNATTSNARCEGSRDRLGAGSQSSWHHGVNPSLYEQETPDQAPNPW